MWGNETQMFHFLSALSSGEYITSFTGLLMSKGGLCSSTAKGYHFFPCASAPKVARASATPAATVLAATADRFISCALLCVYRGSTRAASLCGLAAAH